MKMMRIWMVVLAGLMPSPAEEAAPAKPDAAFFTKLRMDYAESGDYLSHWGLVEERDEVRKMIEMGNLPKALELSEKWLERCPVDADMHAMRSAVANQSGDTESYVYHLYFAMGLMQSLMESGDGKTAGTAWKVISIMEEQTILREIGAKVLGRVLIAEGPCDAYRVQLPTGEETELFFNVSIPMERTAPTEKELEKLEEKE